MAQVVEYVLNLRDQFSGPIAGANSAVNKLESNLGTTKGAAISLGAALGVTFGIAGIGMFVKSMVDAGSKVENARTGLTTLLKDSAEAGQVITNTMTDATKTPFAFEGLLSANKALISAGVESTKARQDVLNLGNAIAATGGGDNELQRMVVNLQQISNTGKATALDIKQFAFAGVNIYKVLEAAGIKANADGEKTSITYDQITAALKKAHEAGGIYAGGLENMAGNTSVQISNLGDAIFQLQNKMFEDLKPAITAIVQGMFDLIGKMRTAWDWLAKNKNNIKELTVSLGAAWLAFKAISLAIPIIKGIGIAMEAMAYAAMRGTLSLSGMGAAMSTALGPITLIALAVGGLVLVFTKLGDAIKEANIQRNKFLGESNDKELTYLQELAKNNGGGQKGIDEAANSEKVSLQANLKDLQGRLATATGSRAKEINDSITETLTKINTVDKFQQGLIPKRGAAGKEGKAAEAKPAKTPATKATGAKSVTINVQIGKLVETINIHTTNIKGSLADLKEKVAGVLVSAVNDFQLGASNL